MPFSRSGLVVVLLALGCTSGQQTKLCGAVGQPCCASASCDEGGRCGGDNLCAACGDQDQVCCEGDVCNGGFTCTGRLCAASLVCPTQCTIGASQCSGGGGIETCVANGVCPEWRTIIAACPANTACVASGGQVDCVEKCAGACTVSALSCTASGLQECVQGAADVCPVLNPKEETSAIPLCVAGATADPDFGWESPTPFVGGVVSVIAMFVNDVYVLDRYGNILHDLLGEWKYELRTTPQKKLNVLATCGIPSYVLAAGQGGTVYLRRGGNWNEEYVGQNVELFDIACDTLLNAVAVGQSGRIFLRDRLGNWTSVDSGLPGPFYGATFQRSAGKAWLVGAGGKVARCDGLGGASVSCTLENVGTTADLFDVTVHEATGRVFAVGAASTVVSRGTLGTWANFPGLTMLPRVNLTAIATYTSTPGAQPELMIAGESGTRWRTSGGGVMAEPVPPLSPDFSSLAVLPDGHFFLGDKFGTLSYGESFISPAVRLGGGKPISEHLNAVTSAGSGRLFAVGAQGGRYRRENATWSTDNGGLTLTTGLAAVTAVNANEVYAVGVNGTVYLRRSGLWAVDTTGQTPGQLRDIAFDSQRIYAVGEGGAWLEKSRMGGTGWQLVNHGLTTKRLNHLAIRRGATGAAEEVVAVGDDCEFLSKVGGTIKRIETAPYCNSGEDLHSAVFTPTGGLIVGGSDALVMQRLNGTQMFTREAFTTVDSALTIVVDLIYANDAVWAVVLSGGLFQRVGNTWREYQPNTVSLGMFAATFDARDGIFAVGEDGLVIRRANPP